MKIQKLLTNWIPTILAVIYVIFFALLSLDSFRTGVTIGQKIGGLVIENIPTALLLLAFFWARQKPKAGGAMFLVLGTAFSFFFETYQRWDTFVLITAPLIVIGILFLLNKEDKNIKIA